MDSTILKDPVQEREVREITSFRDHDSAARKKRWKWRNLVEPDDADLFEIDQYAGDDVADRKFKEANDRCHFGMPSYSPCLMSLLLTVPGETYTHEGDEYDDCFVKEDDHEG